MLQYSVVRVCTAQRCLACHFSVCVSIMRTQYTRHGHLLLSLRLGSFLYRLFSLLEVKITGIISSKLLHYKDHR